MIRRGFLLLLGVTALVLPAASNATTPTLTLYPIPTSGSGPTEIAVGPDGNVWFTEQFANQIGRVQPDGTIDEFPLPPEFNANSGPLSIAAGPDGALWFTYNAFDASNGGIGRMTTAGAVTAFVSAQSSPPLSIITGPDGNLWYVAHSSVGRVEPSTAMVTLFPISGGGGGDLAVAGGYLWDTSGGTGIRRIDTAGTPHLFTAPAPISDLNWITTGPDGNLWATESKDPGGVVRMTPAGVFTRFALSSGKPGAIEPGPDGNLYFTVGYGVPPFREFMSITTSGTLSSVFTGAAGPFVFAPDGRIWFIAAGDHIGVLDLHLQSTATIYLHGIGPTANPPTLILNEDAPTSPTAKYRDSAAVNFNGGNPWKEVGTWNAAPPTSTSTLTALNDLHSWLGLKNSDDQGTQFDLRAEIYMDDDLVSTGITRCITGLTRNANQAQEATVAFGPFDPIDLASIEVMSLKISTRIGTNPDDTKCSGPGGSHNNAVGLRLYFDSTARPARFDQTTTP